MSPLKAPKVSVVMAAHKADLQMAKTAVSCILNQTFSDFEFIIVDDINSKDITDYFDNIKNRDDRIKIIRNSSNIGLTKSLIKAIKTARGKYIARQDIDDISLSRRLEFQVKKMEAEKNLVLLGTWYTISSEGRTELTIKMPDSDSVLKKRMLYTNPFCHASTMFRVNSYKRAGGYNHKFVTTQDLDLWFRLSVKGKFGMIESALVNYGMHANNISLSSKAWIQVWNSFIIRLKHFRKVMPFWGVWLVLPATGYHFFRTLLQSSRIRVPFNLF